MSWFKVDDGFHSHPKALSAGTPACGLWVRCGSWSAQHLTEGFIPQAIADLYGTRAMATALVRAGLWVGADGGFQMHDYLARNPSKDDVEERREAAAERQRRARERARESRVTNGVSHATVTVPPTRPDPTRPQKALQETLPVASLPDRFDEFWQAYPRRVAKGQAVKAWRRAVRSTDPDVIISAALAYAHSQRGKDPAFTAYPATWLNAERWADEPPQLSIVSSRGSWDV